MRVKKQQLELDMEQLTCSKLGKEYDKAVCCHSVYLTPTQSTTEGPKLLHFVNRKTPFCKDPGKEPLKIQDPLEIP